MTMNEEDRQDLREMINESAFQLANLIDEDNAMTIASVLQTLGFCRDALK